MHEQQAQQDPARDWVLGDNASPDGRVADNGQPVSTGLPRTTQRKTEFLQTRLVSLDAYRGLIMVTLAFTGFGLAATAGNHIQAGEGSSLWQAIQYQFSHAQWVGCAYWDLIQPSFMFMVGVALAFSYGRRQEQGQSYGGMLRHALIRSIVLILLGVFLSSNWKSTTNWTFMNVLSQIGLGYFFLFLLWNRPVPVQALAAVGLLVVTWLLYVFYPGSGINLSEGAPEVGVTAQWAQQHLDGVGSAWHKNANVGHAFDVWFLNVFPREEPFTFNKGGYQTINFIPSLATMIFGLMAGELLRGNKSGGLKFLTLLVGGAVGLLLGELLHTTGICPLVKRIWTPSWAIYSTGWCCLILAGLYGVIDILGQKRWAFPLVVVGVNSIAIYCMGQLLKPWVTKTWTTHFGSDVFLVLGTLYEPMVRFCLIGLFFWLVCFYLYRNKLFIRI